MVVFSMGSVVSKAVVVSVHLQIILTVFVSTSVCRWAGWPLRLWYRRCLTTY